MREIKFRGKRIDNYEWVYGYYFIDFTGKHYIINTLQNIENANIHNVYVEVLRETAGQYTSLKDKKGKEIYEGDIVKVFRSGKWRIGKVIYEHSGFTIDVTNNKDLAYGRTGIIEKLVEVIGNIYDN